MVNRCIFIGRVGGQPEIKYSKSGSAVTIFSIACTEKWKDKQNTAKEKTEWIKIVSFNRLAEVCGQYLKKGQQVYIEGKYRTQEYEKDGQKRYSTHVEAVSMQMLGSKQSTGDAQSNNQPQFESDDIPF